MRETMDESGLFSKIVRGFSDRNGLTLGTKVEKGVNLVTETLRARYFLRSCTSVGPGARVLGRPRVENRGSVVIGSAFMLTSTFLPAELLAGPEAEMTIGDGV